MGWGALEVAMMEDSPDRDHLRRVKEKEKDREAGVETRFKMAARAQAVARTKVTHVSSFLVEVR
jgi:hypothetical protein